MTKRLLLIGWNAADWKTIDRLMDQGDMPIMQGLIERGTRGNLTTLHPVLSPRLWTSIATGKRPFKHGIHGFAEPDPKGGARAISNLERTTKAVWNILNQQGPRSNIIDMGYRFHDLMLGQTLSKIDLSETTVVGLCPAGRRAEKAPRPARQRHHPVAGPCRGAGAAPTKLARRVALFLGPVGGPSRDRPLAWHPQLM